MRNIILTSLILLVTGLIPSCIWASPTSITSDSTDTPAVALLGVFHFGETSDLAAVKLEDLLGERRQSEVSALVDQLAAYRPTKILLEYPYTGAERLNERYQQFRSDAYEPTRLPNPSASPV